MSASVPFTSEQRAAIDHRGGLLLTANAGSGKTSVMAERFVRAVIDDGVDVARILAITFTEKAATELKERVRGRFEAIAASAAAGGDPALAAAAREHARATEGAWVSTIHGLCARLLRTYPLTAGVDPRFVVLDEHAARRLAVSAFDAALDALVDAHGERALALIAAYRAGDLRAAILDLHAELRSRGMDEPTLPEPRPAPLAERRTALAIACVEAAAALADAPDGKTVAKARGILDECARLLERAAAPDAPPPAPAEVERLTLPRNGRALKALACEAYRDALAAYADACADAHALPVHALLDELLREFGARYAAAKRDAGAVDFEDLELRANRLLREHDHLRARYAERFVHVMVDEFQDTNPLQLELLERIAGDRLFAVGDELQSIYRFRHADVELFRSRRRALAARGRTATLATNFRSHAQILETLNVAFGPRFGDSFTPLVPGRAEPADAPPVPADEPRVELLVVDEKADWEAAGLVPAGTAGPTPLWRIAEARALARRVRALLDEGWSAGDVVVLLRATGDLGVFERALGELAIPTYVIGGRGYWSQQQVRDLVAYLAVLANPRDGVALHTVLASPLVGLSADGLVQLAATARQARREGEPPDPWWTLIASRELLERLAPADATRVAALRTWLPAERQVAPRYGLESLLDRVLARTRYDLALLRLPDGARRMANVRKLMRLAREFEAEQGRDLRGFVDMVEQLGTGLDGRDDDRESEAPVEGEALDAVRLMTIHRAKGLEFPVVCVADLGRGSPRAGADLVRVDARGRVGIRLRWLGGRSRPALAYDAIGQERAQAEADEEARLFYVAATRARERLILSGAIALDPWPEARPGAAPLTWIGPAFVPDIAERAAPDADREGVAIHGGMPVRYAIVRPDPAQDGRAPDAVGAVADPSSADDAAADAPPVRPPAPMPAPTRATSRPDAPAAPIETLSYSALAEHARCGYRFYLERILRLPAAEEPGPRGDGGHATTPAGRLDAIARGHVVHALLEEVDFARGEPPAPERLRHAAARVGVDPASEELAELRTLVVGLLATPLRARLAAARDVRREQPFAFALDGVPLVGVFDLLAREGERALVVDWKSDRIADAAPAAVVERAYGLQQATYALALLRADVSEVEVVHCFLERPDEPVAATFRAADAPALERRVRARAERIAARDFAVAAEPGPTVCTGCPGRGTLCSWPLERTYGHAEGRLF